PSLKIVFVFIMWQFTETLGEGAYGEVVLAKNIHTNEFAAVKVIDLNRLHGNDIDLHRSLRHENIIRFYGYKQQQSNYYLFLEYAAGGELFDKIEPDVGMSEDHAQHYFKQIIEGMQYLHSHGVAHRDLKPENLLVTNDDILKICDFGLATLFRHNNIERNLTTYCGTAPYSSPEVWAKIPYRGEPVDVWSCGIILSAMLTGELPWDQPSPQNPEYLRWASGDCFSNPWRKIDNLVLALLRRLLQHEPQKRAIVREIKAHPWFIKVFTQGDPRIDYKKHAVYVIKPTNNEQCVSLTQPTTSSSVIHTESDSAWINSFSQPVRLDDLVLNTEMIPLSDMGENPVQHLVHRMTRIVLTSSFNGTIAHLTKLFDQLGYHWKTTAANQITVFSQDRRRNELIFKANIFKLTDLIMVDFRLSKGDGIEFKRRFITIRDRLMHISASTNGSTDHFHSSKTTSTLIAGGSNISSRMEAMDT
ncbi:unnamed protein product, partial [Didymodactylos carnosus]